MKKLILLSVLSLVFGCSYSRTTDPYSSSQSGLTTTPSNPNNPNGSVPVEPTVRFNDVKANVFDVSCTTCHLSRGLSLNFSSYANVQRYLTKIKNDVFVNGSMPPQGGLSTLEKQVLKTWLDTGAPE